MKSSRPLTFFVAMLAVVCSMTYCAVEVPDDLVEKDKVVKPDDEGGVAPPPPPGSSLMDSLVGDFYGTCYYDYRKIVPGQPLIEEHDTTLNSAFNIVRKSPEIITLNGCGVALVGDLQFPVTSRTDSTYNWQYYFGEHFQSLTIDFPNRTVTALHQVNPFGGGTFILYTGVWNF